MKILSTLCLSMVLATSAHAVEQASITLDGEVMSSFGGGGRLAPITVKVSRGFFDDGPISNADKIKALQNEIGFYQFIEAHKIDLSREVSGSFDQKPLVDVIKNILPGVKVTFEGVDPDLKVKSYVIKKAKLKRVLEHLNRAAGVQILYNKEGMVVTSVAKD